MGAPAEGKQSVEEGMRLRNYTRAKQDVAEAIRAAKRLLQARGAAHEVDQCQALLVKLAEDRFNLAVVGQFKRGKSSLMNALIGRDLLPTDVLPLTSAITSLCYGPEARVLLKRKGWALDQEIPLSDLGEYVTEQGNPGNEKRLLEARVEVPVPFLRHGLYFIDTPGVGSARHENTATTYAFLPEADAIVFVTSVETPLGEAEQRFLSEIREHARKLFVVLNKVDLLGPADRERVLSYVKHGILNTLTLDDVRFFPISARQGLAAKLSHDGAGIRESGLEEFENTLTAFLGTEKERTFLVAILDRAAALVPTDSGDVRTRIESLRAPLLADDTEARTRRPGESATVDPHVLELAVADHAGPEPGAERAGGGRTGACHICAAQGHALFNVFAKWQYMLATDEATRSAFAGARGFCHVHTWQFQQIASPRGISEGYAPLIDAVCSALRETLERAPQEAAERLAALLPTSETCPACHVLQEMEQERLQRFFVLLGSMDREQSRVESAGLCLPHLRAALARAPEAETIARLLREGLRGLEELSEDLRSYALKRDALRRRLLNANEESAWRRALVSLTGERAGRGPWSDEAQ